MKIGWLTGMAREPLLRRARTGRDGIPLERLVVIARAGLIQVNEYRDYIVGMDGHFASYRSYMNLRYLQRSI